MNKLRLICIPLLLALPFATQAASFDCAKALSPVETVICASPEVSVLDGTLGQAFATALKNHADKAVILKLDEQHWLAERDDFAWAFLTSRLTKELPEMLAVIYQERIAFLRGLDAPSTSKPLDIILSAIVSSSVASSTPNHDLLESLAKRGAPITLAKEVEIGEPARFRLHPDAKLAADMEEIGDGITDRELPGSSVSSMYTIRGSYRCWSEVPYRIVGTEAVSLEEPMTWSGEGCMSVHRLARIGDSVTAVTMTVGRPVSFSISASAWDGKRFKAESSLLLRFNRVLSVTGSACAPKQSPCDDFGKVALAAARRYDRRPLPGVLDRPLVGAAKVAYDAALAVARGKGGIASVDPADSSVDLPDFGTDVASSHMSGYGKEATTFPIEFRGETLVGLIGHGHVGWRDNDDWMVSAWRLKDGTLEPVASAYVALKRGELSLSAVMPVAVER